MEYPEPTIDVETELQRILAHDPRTDEDRRVVAIGLATTSAGLRALLAQAWEEGRWSPPGACANPYGQPAAPLAINGAEGYVGLRLLHLRKAAQAALAWLENMTSTKSRDVLKDQLRAALGGGK